MSRLTALRDALSKLEANNILTKENYCGVLPNIDPIENVLSPLGMVYFYQEETKQLIENGLLHLNFTTFTEDTPQFVPLKIVNVLKSVGFTVDWDNNLDHRIIVDLFAGIDNREEYEKLVHELQKNFATDRANEYYDMTELELGQVTGRFTVGCYSRKIYSNLLDAIKECESLAYTTKQKYVWVYDQQTKEGIWHIDGRDGL